VGLPKIKRQKRYTEEEVGRKEKIEQEGKVKDQKMM